MWIILVGWVTVSCLGLFISLISSDLFRAISSSFVISWFNSAHLTFFTRCSFSDLTLQLKFQLHAVLTFELSLMLLLCLTLEMVLTLNLSTLMWSSLVFNCSQWQLNSTQIFVSTNISAAFISFSSTAPFISFELFRFSGISTSFTPHILPDTSKKQ